LFAASRPLLHETSAGRYMMDTNCIAICEIC
jgi:hypothetical protein